MTAILGKEYTKPETILYMALELSNKKWKLGFSNGEKQRIVTIDAGNWSALHEQIARAKTKLGLPEDCGVVSLYEAGRDGFWIHRALEKNGIENIVVDSSSIEVSRRKRRAKTDSIDVVALLHLLMRHRRGEKKVFSMVRIPTVDEEDNRRLTRERGRLLKERGSHSTRIVSLLVLHGIRLTVDRNFLKNLGALSSGTGEELGADLVAELIREYERYQMVDRQIKDLEAEQRRRALESNDKAITQINHLRQLKSLGWQTSWVLVMEIFSWREYRNRRELAGSVGLTPTPYASGDSQHEQGISKAGNRRVRTLLIELSWLWLRYQPNSVLTRWFNKRFATGGKRMRRIGIVALARRLLIALWHYLTDGVIPEGAVLKTA